MRNIKVMRAVAWSGTLLLFCAMARAEVVDPASVRADDVGPPTTYGETPAEAANKKIVFEWNYLTMVERKPKEAFAKYVSPDYCNHGHLSTGGQRDCMGYVETVSRWVKGYGQPLKPGDRIEMPRIACVDGEMVTMYGAGVDIFRVHNGKITDHWDASPPAEITLKAHTPAFLTWMLGTRQGPPPDEGKSISMVTVDQPWLDGVRVGPVTPYGETAQEQANKRVVFEWNHMNMIDGTPQVAYERFVSKDYCNHGHISTLMKRDCAGYDETLARAVAREKPAKLGDQLEIPVIASVDGEMVTMYGAGVDIFRVHDGKITDHWDASPPATITLKGHDPKMVAHMVKVVAGEEPLGAGPAGRAGVVAATP